MLFVGLSRFQYVWAHWGLHVPTSAAGDRATDVSFSVRLPWRYMYLKTQIKPKSRVVNRAYTIGYRKHPSASHANGRNVEHVAPRVWGGAEMGNAWEMVQNHV